MGNQNKLQEKYVFVLLIQLSLWARLWVTLYCDQWKNTQCSFKYFEQCMCQDISKWHISFWQKDFQSLPFNGPHPLTVFSSSNNQIIFWTLEEVNWRIICAKLFSKQPSSFRQDLKKEYQYKCIYTGKTGPTPLRAMLFNGSKLFEQTW